MEKEKKLSGKTAIITGGTQGIGEATARQFAGQGAAGIVICGRNERNGNRIAKGLTESGCPTHFIKADLSRVAQCKNVFSRAVRIFGTVHVLVNVAGITDRGTIETTTPELFDRIFAVNARAPFFLMQDAVKHMRRSMTAGVIINVISMCAHGGPPFLSAYSGSKGALAALTKNTAYATLKDRIRVIGLNIGQTDTPGEDRIQKKSHGAKNDWLSKAEKNKPLQRLLKVDEIARFIACLVSGESGMLTGALIDFDQAVIGCTD
ncbi:MAG: SDR family oxidoreductase [Spirochaetales bacterium]|nr:SDR family oxidoreductase [Spirochaetales bacterium]